MTKTDEIVAETLKDAANFRRARIADVAARRTFGYFTHHPVASLNRKRLALLLDSTHTLAPPGSAARVLDIACGGGIVTGAVSALGHRTLGIDISTDEIRLAKDFARYSGHGGVFWNADVLNQTSWERTAEETLGGKPTVVLLAYALHHLPQVAVFIERLGRWLDSGSSLVINEENPDSPLFRLKHRVRGWLQNDTGDEWHRSFAEWSCLLENSGFAVSRPRGADPLPGMGRFAPGCSWSLIFTARRR